VQKREREREAVCDRGIKFVCVRERSVVWLPAQFLHLNHTK